LFGKAFEIEGVGRLMRNDQALHGLVGGEGVENVISGWEGQVGKFKSVRMKYLMY
jgi:hypothetical protein